MAILKNEHLEILKDIELYLYSINKECFVETNNFFVAKKTELKDKKALELYFKLYAMIEEFIKAKEIANDKSNQFNKNNKEYHRIMNNISQAKRKNNIKLLKYWQNELKKYKEKK